MAIKKSQLYTKLWQACDELRGGMDASQYKDYVLVILFIKYISDRAKNGDADLYIDLPEGCSFDDLVALKGKSDIGGRVDADHPGESADLLRSWENGAPAIASFSGNLHLCISSVRSGQICVVVVSAVRFPRRRYSCPRFLSHVVFPPAPTAVITYAMFLSHLMMPGAEGASALFHPLRSLFCLCH